VVGNPPFIGPARMRDALGDGYTETVRKIHNDVGESSDFVMYWWNHAAELARVGKVQRFGFITTNSLRQTFNRRVLETHMTAKNPLSLLFAVPDHPWVDSADGAAVRIAMTTGIAGVQYGLLQSVTNERIGDGDGYEVELADTRGKIQTDVTIGANVAGAAKLQANAKVSSMGVKLHGKGFLLDQKEASNLGASPLVRPYVGSRSLAQHAKEMYVIDAYGLTEKQLRVDHPHIFQILREQVFPERAQNRRATYRRNWWIFGEPRRELRAFTAGLTQATVTSRTAKHRIFRMAAVSTVFESEVVVLGLEDLHNLGILSSSAHTLWALAKGSILGPTPRYNNSICFETFPFPDASEEQKSRIRELAEQLDTHRKRQQEQHPDLTMTGMYNVLEKLRSGDALTAKEKSTHEQGLVSVLKQLHDELDKAVFDAYGWPATLSDAEILERLVALNAERAAEEAQGKTRWLRPEYQCPSDAGLEQGELAVTGASSPVETKKRAKATKHPWPKSLPDQVRVLREALTAHSGPVTVEAIARQFTRARKDRVEELLQTLVAMGQARKVGDAQFIGG
jgi:hypothetical protein